MALVNPFVIVLAPFRVFLAVLLIVVLPALCVAAPVAVLNPGFEDPVLADGAQQLNSIPGWTWVATGSCGNPTNHGLTNPTAGNSIGEEGSNYAFLQCPGYLSQVLSEVLLPDTTYTLQVLVGDTATHFLGGYAVSLLAGGVTLASDSTSLNPLPFNQFLEATIVFANGASHPQMGSPLEIRLWMGPCCQFFQNAYDHVRLDATNLSAPVPEPSAAVLVSTAVAAISLNRRRKDNSWRPRCRRKPSRPV